MTRPRVRYKRKLTMFDSFSVPELHVPTNSFGTFFHFRASCAKLHRSFSPPSDLN